jgi:prepilin-type N-terminal cleavage/methylation domain-containing protein
MKWLSEDMPNHKGFTLIELSIVLVIIGLIVGGVLVGRDLINAAEVRATIAQIEKYQTAVNTFRAKYGFLPGDLNAAAATQFGFTARGSFAGQGDGNGLIEGVQANATNRNTGLSPFSGEAEMFWVDLTTANGLKVNMVDGSFNVNNMLTPPVSVSSAQVVNYFPAAKLGKGNYIYVWSGGWNEWWSSTSPGDSVNYFGISAVVGSPSGFGVMASNTTITVQQAYSIDKKIDDGFPQSGRVMAMFAGNSIWAAGGNNDPVNGEANVGDTSTVAGGIAGPVTSAGDIGDGMAAGPNSCYDGNNGLPEQYSLGQNGGANPNCALSFQFQ